MPNGETLPPTGKTVTLRGMTIADLEGEQDIRAQHLTEAIGYRTLDRKLWAR